MRRTITLLVMTAMLAIATPAHAQKPVPIYPEVVAPTPTPDGAFAVSPESVAAGDDLVQAVVRDSGAMEVIYDGFASQLLPPLRNTLLTSPLYRQANPRQRAALTAFIDSLPDFFREQITIIMADATPRAAPRIATRMSVEHLSQTAAFLRSPELRPGWEAIANQAIQRGDNDAPTPTFPEWRDTAFAQTEAGRAFAVEHQAIADILDEEFETSAERLWPLAEATLTARMCEAMGDDCPAQLRNQAERI